MTGSVPQHSPIAWQLSDTDMFLYVCLKSSVASSSAKCPRNLRLNTFSEALDAIKSFVCRSDKDDPIRGMVCGIYWLPDGLAVNIHRLRQLVPKCKSSINGSLQKLGFTVNLGRSDCAQAVTSLFPFLKDNNPELRKWTIRKRSNCQTVESPPASQPEPRFEISLEGIRRDRDDLMPAEAPQLDMGFALKDEDDLDAFEIPARPDAADEARLWAGIRPEALSRGPFASFIDDMWDAAK